MSPGGFRSLTTRLIGWTLLAVGGVYAVTLVTSNALSRRMALAAAEREAESETESAASRIRDVLHAVEERTRVLAGTIEALDPDLASLDRLLRRFVPGNPDVWGAGIAFEPGAVSGRAASGTPRPCARASPGGRSRTSTRAAAGSPWPRTRSPCGAPTGASAGS